MKHLMAGSFLVVPLALLVLATGCQDPKKAQIEGLNKEVEQLRADLATAQAEKQKALEALAQAQAEKQNLESQMGSMQSQMGELEQRLGAARTEAAKANPVTRHGWIVAPGVSMISVSSDLLFSSGKADLTPAGKAKIRDIARDIRKEYASRDIYVIGHTDTDPIRKTHWKDNWELSVERALTVTRALQAAGISGKQIMAAGRSEYQPEGTKAKSRRVEIYAVERSRPAAASKAPAKAASARK